MAPAGPKRRGRIGSWALSERHGAAVVGDDLGRGIADTGAKTYASVAGLTDGGERLYLI